MKKYSHVIMCLLLIRFGTRYFHQNDKTSKRRYNVEKSYVKKCVDLM